ncbi:hypothetical protein LJC27_03670 [Christensenellaceae bacterium OttesenSCG-928-M15]|nr:hypothetical protein [Christensenellaceae bacterium OttesenSCG-928-M15]
MLFAGLFLNEGVVGIFAPKGSPVWPIATHGFFLYSFAYLLRGVNIFASSLFTALNNGKVSAILSFLRTFLFIVAALLLLPQFLGVDGVWLAVPIAEGLSLLLSLAFLLGKRKVYGYA